MLYIEIWLLDKSTVSTGWSSMKSEDVSHHKLTQKSSTHYTEVIKDELNQIKYSWLLQPLKIWFNNLIPDIYLSERLWGAADALITDVLQSPTHLRVADDEIWIIVLDDFEPAWDFARVLQHTQRLIWWCHHTAPCFPCSPWVDPLWPCWSWSCPALSGAGPTWRHRSLQSTWWPCTTSSSPGRNSPSGSWTWCPLVGGRAHSASGEKFCQWRPRRSSTGSDQHFTGYASVILSFRSSSSTHHFLSSWFCSGRSKICPNCLFNSVKQCRGLKTSEIHYY